MKTFMTLSFFIIASAGAFAQVIIQPKIYSNYDITLSEITRVTLYNSSSNNIGGRIEVEVIGRKGEILYMHTLENIIVKPGQNLINLQNQGISNIGGSSQIQNYIRSHRKLPIGEYNICTNFYGRFEEIILAEHCDAAIITPLNPVQLETPENGSETSDCSVILSWSPPIPLVPGINYNLRIVELKKENSEIIALTNEVPVISITSIGSTSYQLTSSSGLKNSTNYSWQVSAVSGNEIISISEPGYFMYKCTDSGSSPTKLPADTYWFTHSLVNNKNHVLSSSNTLKIFYKHNSGHLTVSYQIIKIGDSATANAVVDSNNLNVQFGINLLYVTVPPPLGTYHLVIKDHYNNEHYIEYTKI